MCAPVVPPTVASGHFEIVTKWTEIEYFLNYLEKKGWRQGHLSVKGFRGTVTVDGHSRVAYREVNVDSSEAVGQHELPGRLLKSSTQDVEDASHETYDFFICHASEDKDELVRDLADLLKAKGACVWYDEFTLRVGSRLRRSIERGLLNSRFGIVVVSGKFFEKDWPQIELDGLFALDSEEAERILPIWHEVTRDEVARRSPILADIVALNTSVKGVDEIACELMDRL